MAGMEIANAGYGFACRIDNIKEGAKGNRVISGCEVTEQGTPDMTVDIAAGIVRIDNAYKTISAVDNQAVTAADGSNDRYDIIAVGKDGTVDYTAGTAAANPYPPDLPADHILLAVIWVEHGSTTVETSDIHDNRIIYEDSGVQVPIGTILSWAKTLTGVPALPTGFVECDGGVLSDAESPLNGQTIPDLNGDNRFLRGNSTSGGTGGTDDATHDHGGATGSGGGTNVDGASGAGKVTTPSHTHSISNSSTTDNQPPYYDVVLIMRVK